MTFVNSATGIGFIPDSVSVKSHLGETVATLDYEELQNIEEVTLDLQNGTFNISVYASDYHPMHIPLEITNSDARGFTLNLDPIEVPYELSDEYANRIDRLGFTTLIGYVLDPDHNPLAGVRIFTNQPTASATTDENGYYQLRIPVSQEYLEESNELGFPINYYTDIYYEKEGYKTLILGNHPIGIRGVWYGTNPSLIPGTGVVEHRTPLPWEIDRDLRSSTDPPTISGNGVSHHFWASPPHAKLIPSQTFLPFSSSNPPSHMGFL